jgi:hypothetical protein
MRVTTGKVVEGTCDAQIESDIGQFDGLLARMQMPAAKNGMAAAFDASPKALGRAAEKAARK